MEDLKMKKFVDGLRLDIKKDVKLHEPTTYAAALKKAFVSEAATNEINGDIQTKPTGDRRDNFREHIPHKQKVVNS